MIPAAVIGGAVGPYNGRWGGGGGGAVTNSGVTTTTTGFPVGDIASTAVGTQEANFDYIVKSDDTPQIGGGTTQTGSVFMAQKMIPKGFTIDEDHTCTIFTNAGFLVTSLKVYKQEIEAGPTATTILTTPLGYTTNLPSSFAGTAVGNGSTAIIIEIDIGSNWTTDTLLIGAKITMKRI